MALFNGSQRAQANSPFKRNSIVETPPNGRWPEGRAKSRNACPEQIHW